MGEKLVLTQDSACKIIEEVIEKVQGMVHTANEFCSEINDVYDKSDLAFLKRISQSLGELEISSKGLIADFAEIENTLAAYYKESNHDSARTIRFREV